jgi:hypothetical protein
LAGEGELGLGVAGAGSACSFLAGSACSFGVSLASSRHGGHLPAHQSGKSSIDDGAQSFFKKRSGLDPK